MMILRKSLTKLADRSGEMLLALASGILMGCTVAPVEAWYLAWIAIAPLWYLLCTDRQTNSAVYGLVWGVGFYGLALSWLFGIHPMTWMGVPYLASLGIATFCLTFVTLWGASLAVFWSLGLRSIDTKFSLHPLVRVLLGTVLWCVLEELYSLTDLWWTSVAMTQSPHNLAILHLGQLSGPTTVSGAIVCVNGLIAEGCLAIYRHRQHHRKSPKKSPGLVYFGSAIAAIIIFQTIGFNLEQRSLIADNRSSVKIGIIQGNVGNEVRHYRAGYDLAMQNYTQGYISLAQQGVAAVVTPETALPYRESQIKDTPFYQAILDQKIPAFVGGFGEVPGGIVNSLLMMNGNGEEVDRYDKWKLVPLGEYIPFEQFLGTFVDTISPLDSHLKAGRFAPIINTSIGKIIFGICYDSAYPEHFRQQAKTGEFAITASNDAHYGIAMPAQHHAIDLIRAIETDRWMVRASNTGYSAIIDPHGRTQWISKLNEFTTHAHEIYRRSTQTLYVRFGNWLTPLLLAIGLILLVKSAAATQGENSDSP